MSPGMVVCHRSPPRACYGVAAQPNLETRPVKPPRRDVISSTRVQYGPTADLVAPWGNGQRDRSARRDIWLTSDGQVWNVRARQGGADGRGVVYDFTRDLEARPMGARLIATAPGGGQGGGGGRGEVGGGGGGGVGRAGGGREPLAPAFTIRLARGPQRPSHGWHFCVASRWRCMSRIRRADRERASQRGDGRQGWLACSRGRSSWAAGGP